MVPSVKGSISPSQNGPGSNSIERVFHTSKIFTPRALLSEYYRI